MSSRAVESFDNLSLTGKAVLAGKIFNALEYGPDGKPGSEWSADTFEAISAVFDSYGVVFTDPNDAKEFPEPDPVGLALAEKLLVLLSDSNAADGDYARQANGTYGLVVDAIVRTLTIALGEDHRSLAWDIYDVALQSGITLAEAHAHVKAEQA